MMLFKLNHLTVVFLLLYGMISNSLASTTQPIWIDSDPACGNARTDDVDDCWALLMALRSQELNIRGISTVFGNVSGEKSNHTAVGLVRRFDRHGLIPNIFRGADSAINLSSSTVSEATNAMSSALSKGPMTLVALGPLTNIATLILKHPEHHANIIQVIAIAGQRSEPGLGFYPGESRLFHLHDLNLRKDVAAFDVVLRSSIPLTLVPYEVATKISIGSDDLVSLGKGGPESQWLSEISKPWLEFWNTRLKTEGFHPFDSLAIGVLTQPSLFTCDYFPAKLRRKRALFGRSRDYLLVSRDFKTERTVKYCYDVDQSFKSILIGKLG